MRTFVLGSAVVASVALGRIASADQADDLVARGQELAKQGEWSQAIAAFKAAELQHPRAADECMIALAYTRRELWPQAELYFARCHARATAADPLPDWAAEAESQLAAKLAGAGIARITITASPATSTVAISGFPADETFRAGSFHLAAGHYALHAMAPGYSPRDEELTVGAEDRTVDLALTLLPPPPPAHPYRPWAVMGLGAGIGIVGLAVDLGGVQPLEHDAAKSRLLHDRDQGSLVAWKSVTVGCWALGAAAIGVGAWLLGHRDRHAVDVSAQLDRSGGMVFVGWSR